MPVMLYSFRSQKEHNHSMGRKICKRFSVLSWYPAAALEHLSEGLVKH